MVGREGYSTVIFFFFSSRRRHTRYWRDWSSDVCSSDLRLGRRARAHDGRRGRPDPLLRPARLPGGDGVRDGDRADGPRGDRKSVVEGKSVDLGGRRIIKKKKR